MSTPTNDRLMPLPQATGGYPMPQVQPGGPTPTQPRTRVPTTRFQQPGAQQFTATNNLRSTQVNPVASGATRQAMGLAQRGLSDLYDTPDRGQIAQDVFGQIRDASEPQFQKDLQGVGRRAAALGRLGAGMTTSELGDVVSNRERDLALAQRGLSTDAASRTLDDRLGRFNAAAGATGMFEGIDRGRRDEIRGERVYQNDQQQQALNDYIRQRSLEEMLLQGEFDRNFGVTDRLLGYGYGG